MVAHLASSFSTPILQFLGFWYEVAVASNTIVHDSAHKEMKMGAMVVKKEENLLALTTTYYM